MSGAVIVTVLDSEKLRDIRKNRRLSQQRLALVSGLYQSTISRLESGRYTAQGETINKLAAALEVEPQELMR